MQTREECLNSCHLIYVYEKLSLLCCKNLETEIHSRQAVDKLSELELFNLKEKSRSSSSTPEKRINLEGKKRPKRENVSIN